MKLSRFKIGDPVLIHATVSSHYATDEKGNRTDHKYIDRTEEIDYDTGEKKAKLATVVGLSKLVEGVRTPASGGSYYAPDDYEPAFFTTTKVVHVWKVRTTMTSKEVAVMDEDIEPAEAFVLPNAYSWPDSAKEFMRTTMKSWPRDSKGKWLKNSPAQP